MFVEVWSLSSEADLEHFETPNIRLFAKKTRAFNRQLFLQSVPC